MHQGTRTAMAVAVAMTKVMRGKVAVGTITAMIPEAEAKILVAEMATGLYAINGVIIGV